MQYLPYTIKVLYAAVIIRSTTSNKLVAIDAVFIIKKTKMSLWLREYTDF